MFRQLWRWFCFEVEDDLTMVEVSTKEFLHERPRFNGPGSVGLDLRSNETSIKMVPWTVYTIRTGIHIKVPQGFEGSIRPRWDLASRGIVMTNPSATIDTREVCVLLHYIPQPGDKRDPIINLGDCVAQLVISPCLVSDRTFLVTFPHASH